MLRIGVARVRADADAVRQPERDRAVHHRGIPGVQTARDVGAKEGLFVCPEGAACFAALKSLRLTGKVASGERVIIFNTGSGIKYLDCYQS